MKNSGLVQRRYSQLCPIIIQLSGCPDVSQDIPFHKGRIGGHYGRDILLADRGSPRKGGWIYLRAVLDSQSYKPKIIFLGFIFKYKNMGIIGGKKSQKTSRYQTCYWLMAVRRFSKAPYLHVVGDFECALLQEYNAINPSWTITFVQSSLDLTCPSSVYFRSLA